MKNPFTDRMAPELRGLFEQADPPAFALMLTAAKRARFKMVALPEPQYFAMRIANEVTWLPDSNDQYFNGEVGDIVPLELIHHVMHYLCYLHGGSSTRRKPESMLYFENIACNIDSYFGARIVQKVGVKAVRKGMLDLYPFVLFEKTSRGIGRRSGQYLRQLSEEDPFGLYKKVVAEVDEVQRLVKQVSLHFEPGDASRVPLAKLGKTLADLPYLTFSSYFNHNLHLMFARFHEGTRSTKADQASKRRCQQTLASAGSFADFMTALGATATG